MNSPRIPAALDPPPVLPARAALFLDLDGTLLDFAARPDAVVVESGLREAIGRLQHALDGALAIVSGRPLDQIDALARLPDIAAAGMHGAELRDARGRIERAPVAHTLLARARQHAQEQTRHLAGVLVEDKGDAIALHYRLAPQAAATISELAAELLRIAGSGFALQHGNHVIELRASGSDKGTAIAALLETSPFAGRQAWMVGDDLTDEHAFAVVNAREGTSVIVGPRRPTSARHAFPDPAAVRHWLAVSADALDHR